MDAEYGEVETSGNVAGKTFYECRLLDSVENADNDNDCYDEIIVPAGFEQSYIWGTKRSVYIGLISV